MKIQLIPQTTIQKNSSYLKIMIINWIEYNFLSNFKNTFSIYRLRIKKYLVREFRSVRFRW